MCTQLHDHIMPAIAMLLQNDGTIAKSPPIFKDYMTTAFTGDPTQPNAYDKTNYDDPGRTMALQHMEQLVGPLAQNVIAVQKILETSSLKQTTGEKEDDAALAKIREELLKTLAMQSVSLDLINGFVTTQQLGDMQHAGTEYLSAIQDPGESAAKESSLATPTANPAFQEPDQPGLPPNPYTMDLSDVPGLQLGYNRVSVVVDALQWVRGETSNREDAVAKSASRIAAICMGHPVPSPASH